MKKILLFLVSALVIFVSCRTGKETVYIDNYITKQKTDSVFVRQRDSVYLYIRQTGDTVFVTKYEYKYLYKDKITEKIDTVYKTEKITVSIPVEKQLSSRQNIFITLGKIFSIIVLIAVVYAIIKIRSKILSVSR